MRELDVTRVTEAVRELAIETNYVLPADVRERIGACCRSEDWQVAKGILESIEENIALAESEHIPLCQDTGDACVFVDIGQDVHLTGGDITNAINEGIRQGYDEGYLRKSIVVDPLRRVNTGDNTPANIHYEIVPGEHVTVTIAPKGFGSENMSRIAMLPPSAGEAGVKEFVTETVKQAGPNPCPPIVVGVGIGGTFDKAALIAKRALLRPLDVRNGDEYYAGMEEELLQRINDLGIGPQGFGGATTALAVNIETCPTHIAGLPVAVNINCHVCRHASRTL